MIKLLIMKKVKDVKGRIYSYTRERISHNGHCSRAWVDVTPVGRGHCEGGIQGSLDFRGTSDPYQ